MRSLIQIRAVREVGNKLCIERMALGMGREIRSYCNVVVVPETVPWILLIHNCYIVVVVLGMVPWSRNYCVGREGLEKALWNHNYHDVYADSRVALEILLESCILVLQVLTAFVHVYLERGPERYSLVFGVLLVLPTLGLAQHTR